jgi:hypothetical protein
MEEEIKKKRELEEALLKEKKKLEELIEKKKNMKSEPQENEPNVILFAFRMPDGKRLTRRFLNTQEAGVK